MVERRGLVSGLVAAPAPLTDERLRSLRTEARAPAMAAMAGRREAAPRVWFNGERATGSGVAIAAQDQWHLGSITKSMTATLVARLVEQGLVGWDDSPAQRLPEAAPQMREVYRKVTLRHLLSHRSGLPANIPMLQFLRFSRDTPDPRAERLEYARIALGMAPKGAAGLAFEYSNSGYVVAAAMLEATLGLPWEDLMRRHLFEPLGLRSAGFGPPGREGATVQPLGHSRRFGRLRAVRLDNPAVLGPAGRVHMNLRDLLTYLEAHRDHRPLLKGESWEALHTPPFGEDYALGWAVRPNGRLWHNGSNTAWYAEVEIDRAGGRAAAAVANDGHARSHAAVASALAAAMAAA